MNPCRFCGGKGMMSISEERDVFNKITIYGHQTKDLLEIIEYAFQHGYKTNEMKQVNEVIGMS